MAVKLVILVNAELPRILYCATCTIFVAVFSIDGRIYYGGYDCNFSPADGAAWVGSSSAAAIRIR